MPLQEANTFAVPRTQMLRIFKNIALKKPPRWYKDEADQDHTCPKPGSLEIHLFIGSAF